MSTISFALNMLSNNALRPVYITESISHHEFYNGRGYSMSNFNIEIRYDKTSQMIGSDKFSY